MKVPFVSINHRQEYNHNIYPEASGNRNKTISIHNLWSMDGTNATDLNNLGDRDDTNNPSIRSKSECMDSFHESLDYSGNDANNVQDESSQG